MITELLQRLSYLTGRRRFDGDLDDVRPTDPLNFKTVGAVLSIVAVIATIAPTVRALRVDPLTALRHE